LKDGKISSINLRDVPDYSSNKTADVEHIRCFFGSPVSGGMIAYSKELFAANFADFYRL